jgi:imidazole glycerol-phosphate synthase subunit HisH
MARLVIVDYGMANLRSVQKAFERVGAVAEITSEPDRIAAAEKLVLPGVGAFRDAIAKLRQAHMDQPIIDHIESGQPFLGICLGMQMLFTRSHEDGLYAGLNIIPGDVVRFPHIEGLKVPHMGWNELSFNPACPLFRDLPQKASAYFVHSYYADPLEPKVTSAEADYPTPFTAAVWRDNLFATQFHPEKSQEVGRVMLKNFAEM